MKIKHIFMVSMIGVGYPIAVYAGGDEAEHPAHTRSPHFKSILSFLRRSSSHSSSVTINSDQQSDAIVGSLDSTPSMQSSSSSSLSTSSSQSSPHKPGNRLSRAMSRLSMSRTHAPATAADKGEWVIVEDQVKEKAENLKRLLDESRHNLDDELYKAESIVIPGVIQAARAVFEQTSYASQTVAENSKDAVADIKNTLGHLKNVLNNYMEAKEEYERKLELNFERVGDFDPNGLYPYLGCTITEGRSKTCDDIKAIIARKKARATTDHAKWMLRQTEYIFDNSESKRSYDAHLAGQDNLEAAQLEKKEREHYWYLYQIVGFSCAAIEEAAHEYNKILKEYQSHRDSSPDLADHALSLELDVKTNV
jgi:hypothetical protein